MAAAVNIAELVDDLKLLSVSSVGDGSISSMRSAREQRIDELKKANGTLEEVCFDFHKDFKTAHTHYRCLTFV